MFSLFDLRTGGPIIPIQASGGSWSVGVGGAGSLSCEIPVGTDAADAADLWSSSTPIKSALCFELNGVVVEAGPIWSRTYDRDTQTLTLSATGLRDLFDHRMLLPAIASTLPINQFYLPDPASPGGTIPNPVLNTDIVGLDLGTSMKRLVQQSMAWAGGDLPVDFMPDRPGDHDLHWVGAEFSTVGDGIDSLANREKGAEVRFTPRRDGPSLRWLMETATDDVGLLVSPNPQLWDLTTDETAVTGTKIVQAASGVASTTWMTAGRTAGAALVSRHVNSMLTDVGFPLLESLDSGHSSIARQATLDSRNALNNALASGPTEEWAFEVAADKPPFFGTYREGDLARLRIAGDRFIPDGVYEMRIMGLSGDFGSPWVKVSCAPGRRVS